MALNPELIGHGEISVVPRRENPDHAVLSTVVERQIDKTMQPVFLIALVALGSVNIQLVTNAFFRLGLLPRIAGL